MYIRKILFGIVFILISVNISYSQSGWVWQNPKPFGSTGYSPCDFVDVNTGWMIGGNFLAKTTNGGVSWTQSLVSNPFRIYSIDFVNSNTGFVGGGDNFLYRTTNGGTSWDTLRFPNFEDDADYIFFENELTGFVANSSSLLKTVNGGVNWSSYVLPNSEPVGYVDLFNENDGILLCYSSQTTAKIYKTSNAGNNWVNPKLVPGSELYVASFVDVNTGWVSGKKFIFKTTNSGTNWINQMTDSTLIVNSIKFFNAETGYACGQKGKILKTTNGGTNWITLSSNVTNNFGCISLPEANTAYVTGSGSTVLKTTSGGANWNNLISSASDIFLFDVQAVNPSLIFTTGWYTYTLPFIGKSTNSGESWQFLPSVILYSEEIFFSDALTGWVGGYGLAKTSNGGVNWITQNQVTGVVTSIQFLNSQTGWVCNSTALSSTTNGGDSWSNITFPNSLASVKFFNEFTGYVFSKNGYQYISTNSGVNWTSGTFIGFGVNECSFLNQVTGYITSNSRSIYKTSNAGLNWVSTTFDFDLYDVKFINVMTGWVVGDYIVSHTTDGGIHWSTQTKNQFGGSEVYACDFINENTGWIVGGYGTILKTTTGGNVFISQISTEIPERFSLYQNYPNPFNPSTNIKFDINKQGIATLKVFDLLGKEMETLVDEQLSVGSYEVTFNASSLPSGIYFYVLKTGDFVESKKMILVK